MGIPLKIRKVGNSAGVVLTKDVMARLKVKNGDTVFLTEAPDGYLLTPYDEAFVDQVEAADAFMGEYRDVLRKLAQ